MERPDYRIQHQDILYIKISTLDENLNRMINATSQQYTQPTFRDESTIYVYGYTVSDSGFISLPFLGDIHVVGLTMEDIRQKLKAEAGKYFKDATVNLRLLSFKFTVIGEVNNPGTYQNFNNQLTVLDAIGRAGDITDFGDRQKVMVVRPTREGSKVHKINVQDKNLLLSEGYFLLPNDIVIVDPIKSKPFQLNIPTMTLVLTTISTLILLVNVLR
jgi:polysaccharide export outer membrane protein